MGVALATEELLGVGVADELEFDAVGGKIFSGPEQNASKKLGPSVTFLQSRIDGTEATFSYCFSVPFANVTVVFGPGSDVYEISGHTPIVSLTSKPLTDVVSVHETS